jgi:hypothetical protein
MSSASKVCIALARLDLYLARTKDALERGDRPDAMAHVAELSEIARRLWLHLQDSSTAPLLDRIRPLESDFTSIGQELNRLAAAVERLTDAVERTHGVELLY